MAHKFTVGVFAIIFDEDDRILCVKRNYADKSWTTPGGGMDSGESPFEALAREVKEETGYIVNPKTMTHLGTYSSTFKDDLVLSIKAEIIDREDWHPNNEISEVRFFSRSELPKMHNGTILRIDDGYSGKSGIVRVFSEYKKL